MGQTRLCPIEWPAGWDQATLGRLLAGTPFNCVTGGAGQAAPDGIKLASPRWTNRGDIDWSRVASSGAVPFAISDAFWPDLQRSDAADATDAGPTSSPWLDANGWLIELARGLAPKDAEVWIKSLPPDSTSEINWNRYRLALCEAFAYGAVRPVWLAPVHAGALANGEAGAVAGWKALCNAADWVLQRPDWSGLPTESSLLVLSDFSGPNEYIATETLLLCSRRGLAFTPCDPARFNAPALKGKSALLYLDQKPLSGTHLALVRSFVAQGGVFIALPSSGKMLDDLEHLDEPHPRFSLHRLGRGRVALAAKGFDDPWLLSQDTHLLMSKRHDVARLFNPGSLQMRFTVSVDRKRAIAHVVNYTARPSENQSTVSITLSARTARIHIAGQAPGAARLIRESGRTEVALPKFDVYAAVEFDLA